MARKLNPHAMRKTMELLVLWLVCIAFAILYKPKGIIKLIQFTRLEQTLCVRNKLQLENIHYIFGFLPKTRI